MHDTTEYSTPPLLWQHDTYCTAALFNYILRNEGGLGGTIDRLEELHALLAPAAFAARVVAASEVRSQSLAACISIDWSPIGNDSRCTGAQVVPLLLGVFFQTVTADASYDAVLQLVPVRYVPWRVCVCVWGGDKRADVMQ